MPCEHPEHALTAIEETRTQSWYLEGRDATRRLIATWSTAVAKHLEERYRSVSDAAAAPQAQLGRLAADFGVTVDLTDSVADEEELRFVWGSVADGAVAAHLDLLADSADSELPIDGLAKLTADRIESARFRRATGIPEDDQPLVLGWAAEAMFAEPAVWGILYRDRRFVLDWDGYLLHIEREIPPHTEFRWGHAAADIGTARERGLVGAP
jgi:hypothetical protein